MKKSPQPVMLNAAKHRLPRRGVRRTPQGGHRPPPTSERHCWTCPTHLSEQCVLMAGRAAHAPGRTPSAPTSVRYCWTCATHLSEQWVAGASRPWVRSRYLCEIRLEIKLQSELNNPRAVADAV